MTFPGTIRGLVLASDITEVALLARRDVGEAMRIYLNNVAEMAINIIARYYSLVLDCVQGSYSKI